MSNQPLKAMLMALLPFPFSSPPFERDSASQLSQIELGEEVVSKGSLY
jgi:hypothetical protein